MKLNSFEISVDCDEMHVYRTTPENALLCAVLERAVKDLDITVANGYNNLKSAIAWFNGRYDLLRDLEPPVFTYKHVATELRISAKHLKEIDRMVKAAESFTESHPGVDPGKHTILKVSL